MKQILLLAIVLMGSLHGTKAQNKLAFDGLIVKTNLLNVVAKGPSLAIEKAISRTMSVELYYASGTFSHEGYFPNSYYKYSGFVLRGKKFYYLKALGISTFIGGYVGNLHRDIHSYTDFNRLLYGDEERDFEAHSIRGGASWGFAYHAKSGLVVEYSTSLGMGHYLNIDMSNPNTYGSKYMDAQLAFSLGYRF